MWKNLGFGDASQTSIQIASDGRRPPDIQGCQTRSCEEDMGPPINENQGGTPKEPEPLFKWQAAPKGVNSF